MLSIASPVTASADEVAVTATAAEFSALKMVVGAFYRFVANTNAWICQGITDTVVTANATTDTFTATGHGLSTGQPVQMTAGTSLPTGLSASTTYFAIVTSADTFKLATSRANAFAGTAIDISDAGSGTLTAKTVATPAAGSLYVPLGTEVLLTGGDGPALSVVRDSADGKASLAIVRL